MLLGASAVQFQLDLEPPARPINDSQRNPTESILRGNVKREGVDTAALAISSFHVQFQNFMEPLAIRQFEGLMELDLPHGKGVQQCVMDVTLFSQPELQVQTNGQL